MKKIGILLLFVAFYSPVYAILGLEKIKPLIGEMNAVKVEVAKNADSLIKANTEIGRNMQSLVDLNLKIGNIETKLNAQGNAVIGLKNDIHQTNQDMKAGGNITTGASDELLKFLFDKWYAIIGGLFSFILTLLGGVWGILKFQAKSYEKLLQAKDTWISNLLQSGQLKDSKQQEWENKYIEILTNKIKPNGITKGQIEAQKILEETEKDLNKGINEK